MLRQWIDIWQSRANMPEEGSAEIQHSAEWQIFIRFTFPLDRKDSGISEIQWAMSQWFTQFAVD